MSDLIRIDRDPRGVATIWLTRADKHNALSAQMMIDLESAAQALGQDDSIRVVVLAAEGRSFCAGGDLAWMRAQFEMDAETQRSESARIATALGALYALPQPLIGRVQGNAFGGGVGLACVCDVTIGAETVKMGLTEVKLGLIPANIGPYVVARLGAVKAAQMFMNGVIFDAAKAVDLGVLTRAVPAEDLDAAVEAEVAPYLACAPGAVRDGKALLRALGGQVTQAQVDRAIDALAKRWQGNEAREGIGAFFDKRPAPWAQ
ncbi:crotonase/enoyl-CoA hydratase family protein [Tropicibacter naphthalenivorans]|uniref:Putative enoyl-CoA hydratase echA8 n=1 Tax=Tropicibacter naphthalenivorans TaxID=441103 RepID=A0A0P1GFG6_9RHOB|nr:crotonase/enoyl-CoA hydratase family protein [Tropicibacter naphthalenivorans]CUH80264.1 putative enoyl-CoA hydratase echA8 [Tropicibacter naphthalenivorans]SMC85695.1 methylglutaconyl-CoA hydratase [Tropicibacter naphthalenivorans]